jgi:hypothetical protein
VVEESPGIDLVRVRSAIPFFNVEFDPDRDWLHPGAGNSLANKITGNAGNNIPTARATTFSSAMPATRRRAERVATR